MKIIEVTGDPCVGKSTVITFLRNNSNIAIFSQQWFLQRLGIHTRYSVINKINYEICMLLIGLKTAKLALSIKFFFAVFSFKLPFLQKLNIYRNIVHKYAIHRVVGNKKKGGCILVDEGISHIVYLFTGQLKASHRKLFFQYPNGNQPMVVKLSIDTGTVIERLKLRGHKRIDTSQGNIEIFASENQECSQLQNTYLSSYPRILFLDINNNNQHVIDLIIKKFENCFTVKGR